MRSDVANDFNWANQFMPAISEILKRNAFHLLSVHIASLDKDTKEATDLMITVKGGDVAVRVRRPNCRYRDLTLRAWRSNGYETELDKIKVGCGRWYLYAWARDNHDLRDYMLIDLDRLRASGLLENRKIIPNRDGQTGFIKISAEQMRDAGCLLATSLSLVPARQLELVAQHG